MTRQIVTSDRSLLKMHFDKHTERQLICTNGKRDSGAKFTSPELCEPFTHTMNRPVCPCRLRLPCQLNVRVFPKCDVQKKTTNSGDNNCELSHNRKTAAKPWNWYQRWLWRNGTRISVWMFHSEKQDYLQRCSVAPELTQIAVFHFNTFQLDFPENVCKW